jgi:hypothetical protein
MQKTTETLQEQPTAMTGILADLAAVTDRLVAAVCSAGDGDVRMATAGAVLAATDRLTAGVVEVLSRVSHRGVMADEGLTTGTWLMTLGQRTVADERMLAATAERLADMPTLRGWFVNGAVSWPVARGIVAAVRNLTREQRGWVDDALAADPERFGRLDAEDRVGVVADLADQARPDLHREREQRATEREFVRLQKAFDGSSQGQFALNAENTAVLEEAMETLKQRNNQQHDRAQDNTDADTEAHHHNHGGHGDADADDGDDGDDGNDEDEDVGGRDRYVRRQSWSNAQALVALCKQRVGRIGGIAPSPARPSMVVVADLAALTGDGDGDGVGSATAQLLMRGGRGPVKLTAAAARRLACDASLRLVFADGYEILGSADPYANVSAALRAALVARDGGCRFPGCHQPPQVCENHHVVSRLDGGPTVLTNLALQCPAHHHAIHDGKWAVTLHSDGTMTFTRRGVTLTSQPRAARRFAPADPPPAGRPTRPRPTYSRRDQHGDTTTPPEPPPPEPPSPEPPPPEPPPPEPPSRDDLPF